ncbi:DUF721 domain-containing protein [Candidatus Uhrbacteria bacterium]|nr:DUF721 domain-containing protein [Candidatus Uhrbacteria bacterium]
MSFESMRKILSTNLRTGVGRNDIQIARVFEATRVCFDEVWGEQRSILVRCVSFVDGKLHLETTSASASQELKIQLPNVKNAINRRLGSLVVREIMVSLR